MLCVHVALTNGRGKIPLKIVLVDVDEEREPVIEVDAEAAFPDVRSIVTIDAEMSDLSFPAPGEYRVQAFARGVFIIERSFVIEGMA